MLDWTNSGFKPPILKPTKKITKGKQDRTVPMNAELMEYLLELRGHPHEYVLPHIPDWKNGRAAEVLRAFQKGANVRETKFHGIR